MRMVDGRGVDLLLRHGLAAALWCHLGGDVLVRPIVPGAPHGTDALEPDRRPVRTGRQAPHPLRLLVTPAVSAAQLACLRDLSAGTRPFVALAGFGTDRSPGVVDSGGMRECSRKPGIEPQEADEAEVLS